MKQYTSVNKNSTRNRCRCYSMPSVGFGQTPQHVFIQWPVYSFVRIRMSWKPLTTTDYFRGRYILMDPHFLAIDWEFWWMVCSPDSPLLVSMKQGTWNWRLFSSKSYYIQLSKNWEQLSRRYGARSIYESSANAGNRSHVILWHHIELWKGPTWYSTISWLFALNVFI